MAAELQAIKTEVGKLDTDLNYLQSYIENMKNKTADPGSLQDENGMLLNTIAELNRVIQDLQKRLATEEATDGGTVQQTLDQLDKGEGELRRLLDAANELERNRRDIKGERDEKSSLMQEKKKTLGEAQAVLEDLKTTYGEPPDRGPIIQSGISMGRVESYIERPFVLFGQNIVPYDDKNYSVRNVRQVGNGQGMGTITRTGAGEPIDQALAKGGCIKTVIDEIGNGRKKDVCVRLLVCKDALSTFRKMVDAATSAKIPYRWYTFVDEPQTVPVASSGNSSVSTHTQGGSE